MLKKSLLLIVILFSGSMYAMVINSPILITQPGAFIFASDVTFNPTISNASAIIIAADNVTLDFNGHIFEFNKTNTQINIDAVYVNPSVSNVYIQNGTIQNFNGAGIHVADAVSGPNIDAMTIQNCKAAGIFMEGAGIGITNGHIINSTITSCNGANGNPAYGIRLINTSHFQLIDNNIVENDAQTTNSGFGISIESCSGCELIQNLVAFTGGIGQVAGIRFLNSSNSTCLQNSVHNTILHDITGSGITAGFFLDRSQSIILEHNKSNSNNDNATGAPNSAYGYFAQNGTGNHFSDCNADSNNGGGLASGFGLFNENKTDITICIAKNNNTTIRGAAYGIFLSGNCSACSILTNQVRNNAGVEASFGIADDSPESSNLFVHNFAFNNTTNYSITYTGSVTLPVQTVTLSKGSGFPASPPGPFDNLSVSP